MHSPQLVTDDVADDNRFASACAHVHVGTGHRSVSDGERRPASNEMKIHFHFTDMTSKCWPNRSLKPNGDLPISGRVHGTSQALGKISVHLETGGVIRSHSGKHKIYKSSFYSKHLCNFLKKTSGILTGAILQTRYHSVLCCKCR